MKNTILKIATMKTFTLFICLCLFTVNSNAQLILQQESLSIEQTKDNTLQIELILNNTDNHYQIQQKNNQLVISAPFSIESTTSNINQKNTIVQSVDIKRNMIDSTLTINTIAPTKYFAWQIDNKLTIEVIPLDAWQKEPSLSIHLKETPIRTVLKLLADQLAINTIIDDSVTENISLNFNNVPKNKIIPLILQAKQLTSINNEGILLILPNDQAKKINITPYKTLINNKDDLSTLTIDFNTSKTSHMLDILSSYSESKIIAPTTDLGEITIRTIDLSWLEVLTNIAIIKNLNIKREGNIFTLSPSQ